MASGVGPKLAARLATELKGKIVTAPMGDISLSDLKSADQGTPISLSKQADSAVEDIISALVNLGYQRLEAYHAASKVYAQNQEKSLSELIRLSLKEFAVKDL